LRTPLGDSQKTPERKKGPKPKHIVLANGNEHHDSETDDANSNAQSNTRYQVLHNWEKSLMSCTSLSQLFIHLQTLDESIAWSKSALNARCRLCKRKGDADKMLLCDKCDCGHHIYCLRPPLKVIPEGDWFCSDCKPKDVEKTPRKIRKSFAANAIEDELDNEENENDQDEDDENDDDSDSVKSNGTTPKKNNKKVPSYRKKKVVEETDEHDTSKSVDDENNTEDEEEDDEENDEDNQDEVGNEEEEEENVEDDENDDEENDGTAEDEDMDDDNKTAAKKGQHKIKLNGNHLNRNNVIRYFKKKNFDFGKKLNPEN
jgi:hypothetical protein